MKTATNEAALQENIPTLQLKRPLLQIDKYAARQGVSSKVIEKCGRLGVIQLRRHKGKTYVVDVRVRPYDAPTKQSDKTSLTKNPNESIRTPELEKSAITDTSPKRTDETIDDPYTIYTHNARAKSRLTWKIAVASLTVLLFITLIGGLWFYMNHKTQRRELKQAYAGIQNLYDNTTYLKQQAGILRDKLDNSTAELEHTYNGLDSSKTQAKQLYKQLQNARAELKTTRSKLTQTRQNLGATRQQNLKTAEQLEERIQQLAVRLDELTNPN